MSSSLRSLIFAGIMCMVCSILLTAASTGLQSRQERNVVLDRQKNIIKAVGLIDPGKKYAPETIARLYSENIQALWIDEAGRIVEQNQTRENDYPIYLYTRKRQIESYVVPINSRGLWGPIFGYLALKNDGSTIAGFTVYQHSETPGLGGEIEKEWFQKNFVGKRIVDRQGQFVSIRIVKGALDDRIPEVQRPNYVDGISGATLTGQYLTSGLKDVLRHYEPLSIKFRENRLQKVPD